MFSTLRSKLILAFTIVTFLTVLLSGLGMVFLLRDREVSDARTRIAQLGGTVEEQVAVRAGILWQPDTLSAFLAQRAEDLDVRFLLIDNAGTIISDTANELDGRKAAELQVSDRKIGRTPQGEYSFTTWEGQVVFNLGGRLVSRDVASYQVLMLVPEADITGAWHALLPRLLLSGGIALAVAIGVGGLLARSISRPIAVVTHASEEMARGHYDQRLPVQGRDEIGRLAGTFNQMASQVSRALQAMRDLNGNVAHELKTPLTSIQGYSQALLDGMAQTPEEVEHAARVINDEAERMRRLVEDLLYLSRLESGQLRIERAPVRVPDLLEHAAERIAWQLRDSGRELRVQAAIDLPPVPGDERRLEQVLANLLDNAVRYTPAGGRITLTARWSLDSVTISVHNSGSYIPPDHLARIFERFYQVDPARTRDGHHGGLGLAIAREIVAAHGGMLTATSDRYTGTEFTMVLPTDTARARDAAAWAPPAARPAGALPPPATRGEPAV